MGTHTRHVVVVNGPSKYDLQKSCFGGKNVKFWLKDEDDPLTAPWVGVRATSGDGNSWMVEFVETGLPNHALCKGYFNTKTRRGMLNVTCETSEPEPATDAKTTDGISIKDVTIDNVVAVAAFNRSEASRLAAMFPEKALEIARAVPELADEIAVDAKRVLEFYMAFPDRRDSFDHLAKIADLRKSLTLRD